MSNRTKYLTCDACGMQFGYDCEREITCPGCGTWDDWGRSCTCDECRKPNMVKAVADAAGKITTEQAAIVVATFTNL